MSSSALNRPSADRNLLFGILALQAGLIGKDALLNAMNAWTLAKSQPLGNILLEQGAFDRDAHTLVEALVKKSLELHDGDVGKSLSTLSSIHTAREPLEQIADGDVQSSLMQISTVRPEEDPYATCTHVTGTTTSTGLRFRILRPHAKGGLGEVFVARDEELHREVALKEIQNQHADQPESRARFLLEAEITGGLEHPGIVPVYGLGTYADGRPYYAMRFIKGDSLKDAIDRFHKEKATLSAGDRIMRLRQLLGRFVDVCNAVAYAHSRGVLHRDLKPGNVMLGKYGETLVVDWGLAKVLNGSAADVTEAPLRPSRSNDSTMTQTGTAMGTPAFMSPEQASGRVDQLSPRSDVYSLGATLYCLLTGQTPFHSQDQGQILHKVQQGDCPRPRAVDRRVPPALEALCLKAMALKPQERYPSPQALADDVEKWLADEPVTAHRESWLPRMARWARRHRPLVAAAVALLLTAVVALAAGIVAVNSEKKRTEQALTAESAARQRTVETLNKMGLRLVDLNRHKEAEAAYRDALAIAEQLATEFPTNPDYRLKLAQSNNYLGLLLSDTEKQDSKASAVIRRLEEAKSDFRLALAICEELISQFPKSPDYRFELAHSHNNLGRALANLEQSKDAEDAYSQAKEIYQTLRTEFPATVEYQQGMGRTLNNLGLLLSDMGRVKDGENALREALAVYQKLAADFPGEREHRFELARVHNNLAVALQAEKRPKQAELAWRDALSLQKQLVAEFPTVPEYRQQLAGTYNNLSILLKQTERIEESVTAIRDSVAIKKQLAADFPDLPKYRSDLAGGYLNLADVLTETNQAAEAEPLCREAVKLCQSLAVLYPQIPEYQADLANTTDGLADILARRKEFSQARQLLEQAGPPIEKALSANPRNPFYRAVYCDNRQHLAETLLHFGEYTLAAKAATDLARIAFDPVNDTFKAAALLSRCIPLAEKDDKTPVAKRQELAKSYADRAMETLRQAVANGYKEAAALKKDADLNPLRSRDDFKKLVAEMEMTR
jgi:serine/threonine-protein kinase